MHSAKPAAKHSPVRITSRNERTLRPVGSTEMSCGSSYETHTVPSNGSGRAIVGALSTFTLPVSCSPAGTGYSTSSS